MDDNDRAVTAFTMLGHGTFHSYELVIPVFVAIWLDAFTTTTAVLGVVVGASYSLVGLGAIPSGLLADRFGSKRVVSACLLGMGVSFGLVGLAPTVPVLALALLAWGATASLYHPAALALISRGTRERGTAFAYHGMAGNVGVAAGPLLASVLLLGFHWRVVAGLLVLPALGATVLGLRLDFDETAGSVARGHSLDATDDPASDGGRRFSQPRSFGAFLADSRRLFTAGFAVVVLVGLLYGSYYRGLFTFLPEVLAGLEMFAPIERGGQTIEPSRYVYSGLLLLGAAGQFVGGKIADRIPIESALLGAYLVLLVVTLLFVPAMAGGVGVLLGAAALLGFAVFAAAPINQEAIAAYSTPALRGLSFGYTYTAIFGVGAAGAAVAGAVLNVAGPGVLFGLLGGCLALVVVLTAVLVGFDVRSVAS